MHIDCAHLAIRRPVSELVAFAAQQRLTGRARDLGDGWNCLDVPIDGNDQLVSADDHLDLEGACWALSRMATPAFAIEEGVGEGYVTESLGIVHEIDIWQLTDRLPWAQDLQGLPFREPIRQVGVVSGHDERDLVLAATAAATSYSCLESEGWSVLSEPAAQGALHEVVMGLAAARNAVGLIFEVGPDDRFSLCVYHRSRTVGGQVWGIDHGLVGGELLVGHSEEAAALDASHLFSFDPQRLSGLPALALRAADIEQVAAVFTIREAPAQELAGRLAMALRLPAAPLIPGLVAGDVDMTQLPGAAVIESARSPVRAWWLATRPAGALHRPSIFEIVCAVVFVPFVAFLFSDRLAGILDGSSTGVLSHLLLAGLGVSLIYSVACLVGLLTWFVRRLSARRARIAHQRDSDRAAS